MADSATVTVQEKNGSVTVKRKHAGPGAWSRSDEQELINLWRKGTSLEALAHKYNRSPRAIRQKLQRLGLNVVATKLDISGQLEIPRELPSLEEVLKIVAGAIFKASQPGLGRIELQRLDTIATLYKAYAAGLEQYVGYRKIESKLLEMEEKYAKLAKEKTKSLPSKPDSS